MKKIRWQEMMWVALFVVAACSGGGSGGGSSSGGGIPALMSPPTMSNATASQKNNEGVDHLSQGHYDVAEPLFREAITAQDNFAEAHFNLAVTLDGKGDHVGATAEFTKAKEQGGSNPKIVENDLLKKHLGM